MDAQLISSCRSYSSDRTIKLWNIDAMVESGQTEEVLKLSSQAVVAAHDKDINSLAVAPNDSLLCSGSQVLSVL